MSYNNYHHIVAEDKANRKLLYVLVLIMFCLVGLIWTISWSFDRSSRQLKFKDFPVSRDEVTGDGITAPEHLSAMHENYYALYCSQPFVSF